MKNEEIDVLYLDDNNFLSVQAMYPKKIVIPKSVYDYIADKIRWEERGKLNIAITALEKLACHRAVPSGGQGQGQDEGKEQIMTANEIDKQIELAAEGHLTAEKMIALIRELAVYRQMALRLERCVHDLVKEAERMGAK